MDLKDEIQTAISKSASLPVLKSILICFKENGGSREDAHLHLYELLQEASTEKEDLYLRELIDFTIGYSKNNPTIWD